MQQKPQYMKHSVLILTLCKAQVGISSSISTFFLSNKNYIGHLITCSSRIELIYILTLAVWQCKWRHEFHIAPIKSTSLDRPIVFSCDYKCQLSTPHEDNSEMRVYNVFLLGRAKWEFPLCAAQLRISADSYIARNIYTMLWWIEPYRNLIVYLIDHII